MKPAKVSKIAANGSKDSQVTHAAQPSPPGSPDVD
jgi:hypothetical protein